MSNITKEQPTPMEVLTSELKKLDLTIDQRLDILLLIEDYINADHKATMIIVNNTFNNQ